MKEIIRYETGPFYNQTIWLPDTENDFLPDGMFQISDFRSGNEFHV
jgi:hypothetical protein